jgi:hypothetical protein
MAMPEKWCPQHPKGAAPKAPLEENALLGEGRGLKNQNRPEKQQGKV